MPFGPTVFQTTDGKWAWVAKCGANGDGFGSKTEASVALRLHQVGCKKC